MSTNFTGGMRLRRNSLRSQRRTDHDVQLSLSRLPAHYRRRIYTRLSTSGQSIQNHERFAALLFQTPSEMGGHNKRGFCPRCGSRLFGGAERHRTRHRRFEPGRSELVQTRSSISGRRTRNRGIPWTLKLPKFDEISAAKKLRVAC